MPSPPVMRLSAVEPVRLSLKAEPVMFSILVSVSLPAPPVFWADVRARLTVTPAVAPA